MLIEGPIPSGGMEDTKVTFLSQFLGAFPWALWPLGALALCGTMRTLVEELVHEDEAPRVYAAVAPPPSAPGPFVPLGGTQRLFLSVHLSFWRIARLIVANDTLTPRALSHSSQWRCRVASSFSSSCFHNARLSSAVERMRRLRPPERSGSRSSPSRRRLTQRLMVERETPNSSETSSRGRPRSTAPSTRSLRSFEYAFMADVLAGATRFANRSGYRASLRTGS